MEKKLFLLDGMALIYRAYHALRNSPRITTYGKNTNAQFGFTNTLLELLQKNKPTHAAIVLDTHAPTERHEVFEAYKANRESSPEDIITAIPDIKKISEGLGITILELDGYEADDIIGTLSVRAYWEGFITYMVTSDKDYGQLVNERVFMYKPPYLKNPAQILGEKEIKEKWNIKNPIQIIDILGLMGDAVDNIPGVKGIGEKTAMKLIEEYGTLEKILENADTIAGSVGEKIRGQKENALLSKRLATINLDVPLDLSLETLAVESYNVEKLMAVFTELEFRTLGRKVLGQDFFSGNASGGTEPIPFPDNIHSEPQKEIKNIHTVAHTYLLVESKEEVMKLVADLAHYSVICIDTETTGLDIKKESLVGISFCVTPHTAYYVHLPVEKNAVTELLVLFSPLFDNPNILWVGQNIKFDLAVLQNYDCVVKGNLFDTMLAQYLLDSDSKKNMDFLALQYLNYSPISIDQLLGRKKTQHLNMRQVSKELLKEYAAEDVDITLQLFCILRDLLKDKKLDGLFSELEIPLLRVLLAMEEKGIKIDTDFLKHFSVQLEGEIRKKEQNIYTLTGVRFNIASPKQLGEVLFDSLQLDNKAKKTKTGQYITNEDVLSKLAQKHPVIVEILDYRELVKLKSTYVDALPKLVYGDAQRIHTTFNQTMAVTGRLSSYNPNLQNIPVRTPLGRHIRKAFLPKKGYILLSADYSQIELRIIAALSGDINMITAFREKKDIHTATAAKIYSVSESDVTKEMRYKAKSVNFGIIYGQGVFGLAQNLNISRTEAKTLIDNYFMQYAGIKNYMDMQIENAKKDGYVQTLLGRIRWLRNIHSANKIVRAFDERNAVNMPVQGTAADMIKIAMVNIFREINAHNLHSAMILQVHDELLFEVAKGEEKILEAILQKEMTHALPLPNNVPVTVEIGYGENWFEAR